MTAFLIIDTREQLPLTFKTTDNYTVISKKLDFGDYGLEIDNKLMCVFERKSGFDLFGTLTEGHERFINEINRAKESGILFNVIVEESYTNITNKKFDKSYLIRTMPGYVLIKILHTIEIKYGIHFIFCNDRVEMRDYIRETFNSFLKNFYKVNKN